MALRIRFPEDTKAAVRVVTSDEAEDATGFILLSKTKTQRNLYERSRYPLGAKRME
jgi:hypothetical protein